jgi:hypothetical protein
MSGADLPAPVLRAVEQAVADVRFKLAHGQKPNDVSAWNPLLAAHVERALRAFRDNHGEAP